MDKVGLHVRLKQQGPIPLDADFACGEGELLALVGASGAGKTTILRTIAGLYRPQHGEVTCGEAPWLDTERGINVPPHRRRVGLVFQSFALFPHMTALGNVMAALGHRRPEERETVARALLDQVHLHGLDARRPAELSGGQQQRVAIARALAREPLVLLLDEPFSAVDRPTRRKLHFELAELRKAVRIPIVLVTHDVTDAATLADRICVLDKGETLQSGRPADLIAAPANARVAEALDLPSFRTTRADE
jgi:molybdate transport system ATP-binding protein